MTPVEKIVSHLRETMSAARDAAMSGTAALCEEFR